MQAYLDHHKVQSTVEESINACVKANAPDPYAFMAKHLGAKAESSASMSSSVKLAFPAPEPTLLRVEGKPLSFPVRRIYCVGRNYFAHAEEMAAMHKTELGIETDTREPPFFFQKATSAAVDCSGADDKVRYPPLTSQLEFECELVVALKSGGSNIAEADALSHVYGYGVGVDLTRRDLQSAAKQVRKPWDAGKNFDDSAPCGALCEAARDDGAAAHPAGEAVMSLRVNGELKQESRLDLMIWSVAETIHHLSQQVELCPGDLILTGTPAGVGPVVRGDRVECEVRGAAVPRCSFEVV